MSDLKYVFAYELEPISGFKHIKVLYTKNDIDQKVVLLKFGENDWRVADEEYMPHNKLKKDEIEKLGSMIDNNEIIIVKG